MKWSFFAPVVAAPLGSDLFQNLLGLATSDSLELESEVAPAIHYEPLGYQEGSPAPFAQHPINSAPNQKIRDLKWGELNFIHTTDTHSWLSGHLLEPQFGADWGDFLSFTKRMHERADSKQSDLILVDTGDRTDGNGLGDATKEKAVHIRKLFTEIPYDLITIGNHELYDGHVTVQEYNELFSYFKESYVVSNVYVKAKKVKRQQYADLEYVDANTHHKWIPMGNKYKLWQTKNTNSTVLGLGFLFDFTLNDDHYSKVVKVEKEIKEHWFQSLLEHKVGPGHVDAIVLSGHMPIRNSPEFEAIVKEIREHNAHVPILIFGGHTHIRDAKIYDERAWALESGRYLETIGFASIDSPHPHHPHDPHGPHHPSDPHHPHDPHGPHYPHHPNGTHPHPPNGTHPNTTFSVMDHPHYFRSYIDFNRHSLVQHAQADTFDTYEGHKTSSEIARYRKHLELDVKIACVPQTYYTNQVPYPHKRSLYSFLGEEILPRVVTQHRRHHAAYVMLNTGAIRYDLVKGPFTRDSGYIVTPFSKKWLVIEDVPREIADEVLAILNGYDQVSADIGFKHNAEEHLQGNGHHGNNTLTPGYVTHDDFGDHGDDTKHKGWKFHHIPNVVHAERHVDDDTEEIDLVFEEFLTHFVVKALVDLRKYRLIRPRFYTFMPLHEVLADYLRVFGGEC